MIDLEFIIGVNEAICESENKKSVIINKNNILSALSVQQWYEDDRLLASALLRSLVIAHGFQDGNKRTSAVVANYICSFQCDDTIAEDCILDIATGKLKDVDNIANILYEGL